MWVSSVSQAKQHDAYAIERPQPAVLQAPSLGATALVEKFPWGPVQKEYFPNGPKDMADTFAPPGMSRTGGGYLAMIAKKWGDLRIIRVAKSSDAVATSTFQGNIGTTSADIIRIELKYPGTEGNAVVGTISAATDGNSNHFNITATVTGASGTTTDKIENYNVSGTGSDSVLTDQDKARLKLIGAVVKIAAGRPTNGSATFASGTSQSTDATDYVGTAQSGDKGLAKLEGDPEIRHVIFGDPGNGSVRSTANAGMRAHVELMQDRTGYISGDSGMSSAADARTDVANYRSKRVVYTDPWVYIYDDVDGTKRLVPGAPFAASVASQLPPSTSFAWKGSDVVNGMLYGIVDVEFVRGQQAPINSDAGIATIIREKKGGYSFEAGYVTNAPVDPSSKRHTRTQIGDYIALAFTDSVREFVDIPNVAEYQQALVNALEVLMDGLVKNSKENAVKKPHVLAYKINDLDTANSPDDQANGDFFIPLDVRTSSGMERIFLSVKYGERVVISAT